MNEYQFENVEHALVWSFEHLRRGKFPKTSAFYREIRSEYKPEQKKWYGEYGQLPTDQEERRLLAQKVHKCMKELNTEEQVILHLKFLGDYHSDQALKSARNLQERLRQQGVRTRLSYRYSQRQIAELLKTNHRNIGRKLERIHSQLEDLFMQKRLMSAQIIPLSGRLEARKTI